MPEKVEALGILLILLPGFAAAYLVQLLAARRKQAELDKIIEALLLSLILYLVTLPFFRYSLPIAWQSDVGGRGDSSQIFIVWPHLLALAILALVLGTLYSASINHDWLIAPFKWLKITERSSRSSVWNDVFSDLQGFVQVGLSGGRSVIGWIRNYSDEDDTQVLFLEDAAWVDDKGNETPIRGAGILLSKDSGIEYVMFLDAPVESASLEDQ
jgi:hypothetical protein